MTFDPSSASTVEPGLKCIDCHYDLRGLLRDSKCPECGMEIARSITAASKFPPLPVDIGWRSTVAAGILATAIAVSFQAVITLAISNSSLMKNSVDSRNGFSPVLLFATTLGILGQWAVFAKPTRGHAVPMRTGRIVARTLLPLAAALSYCTWMRINRVARLDVFDMSVRAMLVLIEPIRAILTFTYLQQLATRIGRSNLANCFRALMVSRLLMIVTLVFVPSAVTSSLGLNVIAPIAPGTDHFVASVVVDMLTAVLLLLLWRHLNVYPLEEP